MSDKRPHIKPEELAGLIRQYLAGELDDKAMHALERQALNDPFLADAIEGYAAHSPEQTVHQQELASRLSDRIATRSGRIRPMYYRWAAAAAILLLMFSAGWFLWEQQRETPIASVSTNKPAPEAAPALSEHGDTTEKNSQLAESIAPPAPAKDQEKKAGETADVRRPAASSAAAGDAAKAAPDAKGISAEKAALADVPAVAAAPAQPPLREESARTAPPPAAENNAVRIRGYRTTPLNRPDSQQSRLDEVVVTAYGVQKKQSTTAAMSTVPADSLADVPVAAVERRLQGKAAGVTVDASGNATANDDMAYREPAPVTGFTAFENYLKTKTVNPDNKYSGTVRVSFIVMPDGSLQDFRILRHLNEACDAEAIRVIKAGPAWTPASDRKPTKVKVRVKFTVEKNNK